MCKQSDTWIVVGSSPTAQGVFDNVLERYPDARTITCNAGIYLFASVLEGPRYPDIYWLSDLVACYMFGRFANQAQRNGTEIWTLPRNEYGISIRGMQNADRYLDLPESDHYTRGTYYHSTLSGTICTQIAVNEGARKVVWLGHDGYRSTPNGKVVDTIDGRLGHGKGWGHTQNVIGPFMQAVVNACPDIEFEYYGKPQYTLAGPNVTVAKQVEGKPSPPPVLL